MKNDTLQTLLVAQVLTLAKTLELIDSKRGKTSSFSLDVISS